jgi:hypothetical protein
MPFDAGLWRYCKLAAIVADDHLRLAALDDQPVQFPHHAEPESDVPALRQTSEVQSTIVAAVGESIRHEVESSGRWAPLAPASASWFQ